MHTDLDGDIDSSTKVWRYLDYPSFMWTLQTGQLHFRRSNEFSDPYEGSIPQALKDHWEFEFSNHHSDREELIDELDGWGKTLKNYRNLTFLNCWHQNDGESAAMWEQYSTAGKGIAIQSTVSDLQNSLNFTILHDEDVTGIADVKYIDYNKNLKALEPESKSDLDAIVNLSQHDLGIGLIDLFRFKRSEYRHESEIRLYVQLISIFEDYLAEELEYEVEETEGEYKPPRIPSSVSIYIDVDVDSLINEIFLSPHTSDWVADSIERTLEKREDLRLGPENVIPSELGQNPTFNWNFDDE